MTTVVDEFPPRPLGRLSFSRSALTADGPCTAFGPADGHYSRVCWLPVVGPTAWVLWGTIAHHLNHEPTVVYDVDELTDAVGLGRSHRLHRALRRLARFGIASNPNSDIDGAWQLPVMSPPLDPRHHSAVTATVRRFHHQTIDDLNDTDRQILHTVDPLTYIDHFGGHRPDGATP